MGLADQANLVVSLSLKDQLSGALKGVQRQADTLDRSFGRTQASLARLGGNVVKAGIVGIGAVVGGLAAGFVVSIKAAADFEGQLNTINTVAKLSADDLAAVGESLRGLAIDTGKPVAELTSAYYDLVSAGVDAADAQGVLTAATTLATGGLGTTQETVNLLTTAMNSYGLTAEEVADATDMFAQAIGAGKVTASELAASFATIGPVAASAGVELEEVAAAYAQMTASGIPAAEAATAMRSAITALQAPNENLLALQKKLNVNFAEVAEEEGLATAYQMIADAADEEGIALNLLTGNVNANAYALSVSGENAAGFAENLEAVRSSTDGAGVAAAQAAERNKGLGFQLDRLKVIGKDVAIMFGTEMLPSVTRITTKLGELIELNYPKLEKFAERIGDALDATFSDKNLENGIAGISQKIGGLLDKLGTADVEGGLKGALGFLKDMPWGTISEGLKITGGAAKLIIDTFRSLPPDIQKILIGALAVNKVTGGLLSSVAKDLVGLALKSLTTITAANVQVIGGSVTGPGGPSPAGPSPAGASPLAWALGPIAIGAFGALAIDQIGVAQANAIRNTPLTTDAAAVLVSSGYASVLAHANDPLGQFIGSFLGPGFRDMYDAIGDVADQSFTLVEAEHQTAASVAGLVPAINSVGFDVNKTIPVINAVGFTINQGLIPAVNSVGVDVNKGLTPVINALGFTIGGKIAPIPGLLTTANNKSEAELLRLEHIAGYTAITSRKDLSVNVSLRSTFQVSAREIANQLQHWEHLRGENEFG